MTTAEFLARAWTLANDKARELEVEMGRQLTTRRDG
jgi:hypothetical protein